MKPILIAECCQNHNGQRDLLQRMIHEAAAAGADYLKMQTIRSRELAFRERFENGETDSSGKTKTIKRPFGAEKERLSKLDLAPGDEAWFVRECQRAGVKSMTTVFTRDAVRDVKDVGFDAIKIASYDCRSLPLLRDVKKYWSTLVVSTGATLDTEIEAAAQVLEGTNYTFLHCVTLYPTPLNQLHLRRMAYLRRFTPQVGFSDHTAPAVTAMKASQAALALGATCVERHFTVLGPTETRDGPVSITPAMLKELRAFADKPRPAQMTELRETYPGWEETLGEMFRPLSDGELLNRDYYAGRFASMVNGRPIYNWEDVVMPEHAR